MNNILSNYNLQLLRSIIFAIEKRPNVFIECFLFLGFKFKIESNGYTYKFMINLDIISYEKQKEHRIIFWLSTNTHWYYNIFDNILEFKNEK